MDVCVERLRHAALTIMTKVRGLRPRGGWWVVGSHFRLTVARP